MQPEDQIEEVGQTNPFSNVVGITGKPYEPPEEELKPGDVDEKAVQLLEDALEAMKTGKFHGVAIIMGKPDDKGRLVQMRDYVSTTVMENMFFFTGALESTKLSLLDGMGVTNIPLHEDDLDDPTG